MNLKKNIMLAGLAISFSIMPNLVQGEINTNSPRQPNTPETGRPAQKEKMAEKDKIRLFGEKAFLRLGAFLDRADRLRERVEEHASRFPNPRFDTVIVAQKLEEAREAIGAGRLLIPAIQSAVTTALVAASTTNTGPFAEMRTKTNEVMAFVRTAHTKTIEAIRLIKNSYYPNNIKN